VAELGPATVVSRPPEVVFERLVDDEIVLLHAETGKFVSLNSTGAELWARLESPTSVEGLVRHLVATRRVEADRAEADVHSFLTDLLERGLIRAEASGSEPIA
jgi:hypothetical protein